VSAHKVFTACRKVGQAADFVGLGVAPVNTARIPLNDPAPDS
jgi:hypothetical protein